MSQGNSRVCRIGHGLSGQMEIIVSCDMVKKCEGEEV